MSKIISLFRDEEGIQHAEEALLLSLIAVVAVAAVGPLGAQIKSVFTAADAAMDPVP